MPVLLEFADVDEYIAGSRKTGGVFARIWRDASDEERDAIRAGLDEGFAPFSVDGGYELPGQAVVAAAN